MIRLRQSCWYLLVPALFVAGVLGVLNSAASSSSARAPEAHQAAVSGAAGSDTAETVRVASPLQAQVAAPPVAVTPSPPGGHASGSSGVARPAAGAKVAAARAGPALRAVTVTPVSYPVTLNQDALLPGPRYTVRGLSYTSPGATEVALLLHGFSLDHREWDFPAPSPDPQNPYTYSPARYLAAHAIDAIAVDDLGVGSSDRPSGVDALQLTSLAYASMTHQIVQSLRASYQKVVTVGFSSGGEVANVEAGRYHDVDGLANIGFCDLPTPSAQLVIDNLGPLLIGLVAPYVNFEGTTDARDRMFFNGADMDPAVMAQADALTQPISSAELRTATAQPAKALDPLVNVPVLVSFGQQDAAWLPACQASQASLYLTSPSVTTFILPGAGHALMLHRNAGAFESELLGWLKRH